MSKPKKKKHKINSFYNLFQAKYNNELGYSVCCNAPIVETFMPMENDIAGFYVVPQCKKCGLFLDRLMRRNEYGRYIKIKFNCSKRKYKDKMKELRNFMLNYENPTKIY